MNGIYPVHIICIRDGCSPNQFKVVANDEVLQIKRAINEKNPDIKLTYIMLNKKTNIKIFGYNNKSYQNSITGILIFIQINFRNCR